jgi:ribonuclease HII
MTVYRMTKLKSCYNPHLREVGLDEVGRGCLAGPVVAAAVMFPPHYQHPFLTDSKQLSRTRRNELRPVIERDALAWAIAEVSPNDIDRINILQASFLAMHRAVDALTIKPEHLLVDGNRFAPYPLIPHTCIVKGDSLFLSIAAASVLAKCYRDDLMEILGQQFPVYGWAKNAGYPTKTHRQAIETHGPTVWHRMSFKLVSVG